MTIMSDSAECVYSDTCGNTMKMTTAGFVGNASAFRMTRSYALLT